MSWLPAASASASSLPAWPLAPSPHSHRRVPELTPHGISFQPLGLTERPRCFLALSHTAACPAVYSSPTQIHFLEQIHASVSLCILFPLKLHPHFTCQSHALRFRRSIISERPYPSVFLSCSDESAMCSHTHTFIARTENPNPGFNKKEKCIGTRNPNVG